MTHGPYSLPALYIQMNCDVTTFAIVIIKTVNYSIVYLIKKCDKGKQVLITFGTVRMQLFDRLIFTKHALYLNQEKSKNNYLFIRIIKNKNIYKSLKKPECIFKKCLPVPIANDKEA